MRYEWSRYPIRNKSCLECSSKGDKRFSALFAKLPSGKTIEEYYQLDIKGHRINGDDWRIGKGKPPINGLTRDQLWNYYVDAWYTYLQANPELYDVLKEYEVFCDQFASSDINQARAICQIMNMKFSPTELEVYYD